MRRTLRTVDDESQRDEMNAAIRAQRERGAVPRSMLPPEDELPERPTPPSEPRALDLAKPDADSCAGAARRSPSRSPSQSRSPSRRSAACSTACSGAETGSSHRYESVTTALPADAAEPSRGVTRRAVAATGRNAGRSLRLPEVGWEKRRAHQEGWA